MTQLDSIPGVADVTVARGARAARDAAPALLVEVPHGATRAAHFDALRRELRGPFADDLRDFFFVNTDVGAPEAAADLARMFVERHPGRSAMVIRCLVPRTFVDCNRDIDRAARPAATSAGQMTPGVASYVTDPTDLELLLARHGAYRDLVSAAFDRVCGAGGRALMLHSYAPRSVDVPVDDRIVERLRNAYRPEVEPTWPLRAEIDLITTAPDGTYLADRDLAVRVRDEAERAGFQVAENGAYALHPAALAHVFARRHPGRTLCLEVRRDLLAGRWTPFEEMEIDPAKSCRVAALLAAALG